MVYHLIFCWKSWKITTLSREMPELKRINSMKTIRWVYDVCFRMLQVIIRFRLVTKIFIQCNVNITLSVVIFHRLIFFWAPGLLLYVVAREKMVATYPKDNVISMTRNSHNLPSLSCRRSRTFFVPMWLFVFFYSFFKDDKNLETEINGGPRKTWKLYRNKNLLGE